jgi:DNA repair photolyase
MKPIYEPKGAAKEYGDLALNIYTGCPHRCYYCFAPSVLRRDREKFHSDVRPRENIIEETRRQLEREGITGKLIHLCFTCDPYPTGYDTTSTREIIKLLKAYGNYVQILTKGDGSRDFDLLDKNDWYGVTIDGSCEYDYYFKKINTVNEAKAIGIKTWCSFEPVIDAWNALDCIQWFHSSFDRVKIGKLNYHPSDINWKAFGVEAEALCRELGLDYTIKESLRREMEKP